MYKEVQNNCISNNSYKQVKEFSNSISSKHKTIYKMDIAFKYIQFKIMLFQM